MAAFYGRPYGEGFKGINLGEVLARGQQYREGEQAMQARAQAMKIAQAQEDAAAELRPLDSLGKRLAIRGQIIGAGETADDFLAALPILKQYGLPTEDLPELRSTASETFRAAPKAPEAPRIAPSWMPASWDMTQSLQNRIDLPAPQTEQPMRDLPTGSMVEPADLEAIQRRAQAGLPLQMQARIQDQDIGRALQREQIAANLSKYETQDALRRSQDARAAQAAELARRKTEADIQNAQLMARVRQTEIETGGPGGQAVTQAIKSLPDLQSGAKTALTGFNTIARMEQLLGEGAGARPGMIKVGLGRLFGYQSEDMAKAEEYQLLAETLRGPLREDIVGPGPMTEAEQRLLGQVTGGGSTGRKAAIALLNLYRDNARKRIEGYNEQVRTLSEFDPRIPQVYRPIQVPGAGAAKPAPAASTRPVVRTRAEYDALPSGSEYQDSEGRIGRKK